LDIFVFFFLEINFPSQCYDKTPTKYLNLLPKLNEDFEPNTSSNSYSEDSGSDYMPPFQSPTSDNCNSSEVFSDLSELNIDQFVHEDEFNLCGLLLETWKVTNYIDKQNTYLFALPNSLGCLRGSDAIRKLSKDCGAKNPENLTSTRLRKQVATVAQLLNLSESDIEQLAAFMGHSKEVHKQFYRLSESTFQVAKVNKLLLMMEKGQGQEYRGKSLDEIDINIDSLVTDIEESSDEEIDHSEKKMPLMASTKNNKPEEKKHVRVSWSRKRKKRQENIFKNTYY